MSWGTTPVPSSLTPQRGHQQEPFHGGQPGAGTPLGVQWLELTLQGPRLPSLVGELRSCKPCGASKQRLKKKGTAVTIVINPCFPAHSTGLRKAGGAKTDITVAADPGARTGFKRLFFPSVFAKKEFKTFLWWKRRHTHGGGSPRSPSYTRSGNPFSAGSQDAN